MSATLKRMIRKKQRVFNCAQCYQRECDWREYKFLRKEVNCLLKHQHKTYQTNMVSTNSNKLLRRYVKSQRQDKTGITASKDPTNNQITTDAAGRANILNNHFKLVFTVESNESFPNKGPSPIHIQLYLISLSLRKEFIISCNIHKSPRS